MGLALVISRKTLIFWSTVLVFLALDQWSKDLIRARFFLNESIPVIDGFFNLTYVRNTGAAFGFMAQADPQFRVPFFLIVPLAALAVLGRMFWKLPKNAVLLSFALSLVVAGTVGNLIDRVQLSYVVDFLDFHWQEVAHFPSFNVADIVICVGVGLLLLDSWIHPEKSSV